MRCEKNDNDMKIVLSPHGGSGNHGCEAIVRATKNILPDSELLLFSSAVGEDRRYGLDKFCALKSPTAPICRLSAGYLAARLGCGSKRADRLDRLAFSPLLGAARESDLVMSIGGDNYCYGLNRHILLINREVRKMGIPTALWGCSIEQEAIDDDEIFDDLSGFGLIVARESITRDALAAKGLTNVRLYPDPAFLLDREDLPLPRGFAENNTVGINVSPLIMALEGRPGATLANYSNLVEYILAETGMNVALIPHVVRPGNDDRKPLEELYGRFADTGRVAMVEDCNAVRLKGYIARCRFMVAARTHASIAAYSQCVPTLVVGYSVKARGIARDIFGTDENYVIPVQSLENGGELIAAFRYIADNEAAIRERYASMMERYKTKAAEAGKEIRELCGRR